MHVIRDDGSLDPKLDPGLSVDQVRRLREEFSIYTVDSARVNIASFNNSNIDYFISALKAVL